MSRTKGTPAKRTGGEKKSQGATPKKAKVTKVAPQTKTAIKKVVDKGIHNMRYAPLEENLTGRTELPEKYGGPEPKPERKSKKPNPLRQTTAERIEKENLDRRDAYEKKVRERADRDKFQARVDSEEVRQGSEKKVDKAKARSGKKIRKMSAQGKFSEKLKKYKEVKGAKKMSAPATPKKVVKPYVKKVEPVRTASGKRWFDITPTSDQTDVGKKPDPKARSLHKNARIKSLVDLRERTAADMAKGEAQRLTAAERKVAEKKKAQELIDARKNKKPTQIKKKGKKMAGRPKKTKASVDAKLAQADKIYKEELAKSPDEAKKANTEKKSTKAKTTKVVVEETKPKTTKKGSTPKKPAAAKAPKPATVKNPKPTVITSADRAKALADAKAKAPVPKPAGAASATSAAKSPSNLEKAKNVAKGAEKVIKKVPFGKTALKVGKLAVGTKLGAAVTAAGVVAGPLANYLNKSSQKGSVAKGAVGQSRGSVVGWKPDAKKGTTTAPWGKPGNAPGTTAAPKKSTGYRVEHNDTLSGIAAKAGVTLAELRAANPKIKDPKKIFRNTQINIPKGKSAAGSYTGPVPYRPGSKAASDYEASRKKK